MTIRSRLQLSVLVSISVTLLISCLVFIELLNVKAVVRDNLRVNALTKQIILLHTLTYDYLQSRSERTEVQWNVTYERLDNLLKGMNSDPSGITRLPANVVTNYAAIKETFDQVALAVHKLEQFDMRQHARFWELDTQISSMLLKRNQELYDWVLSASAASNERLLSTMQWGSVWLIALLLVIALVISTTLLLLKKGLLESITSLRLGVETIARGNLEHRIIPPRQDELGELSTTFNTMTAELQGLYTRLNEKNQALQESEQRFRTLVEKVPNIAVQGYDQERRVMFWNRASETLYGFTQEEAMGRRLEDLIIPPEMRDAVVGLVNQWVTKGVPIPAGELQLVGKNGKPVHVFSAHTMLKNALGDPEMYCIDIDIAARKQSEEALRVASEHLQTLFAASPLPMMSVNTAGRVLMWNPAAEQIIGWTSQEATGQPALFVPEDKGAEYEAMQQRALAGETIRGMELLQCRRKKGVCVDFFVSAAPLHNAQGQVTGVMVVLVDITEKRQLEAQFLRAQRLESVGHLAGGIAHDLNNILAPIMMSAPMLRDEVNNEEAKALLDTIEMSAQRGADILKQLLVFSRGGEGQKLPLSLLRLAREMAKIIGETFPKNITFQSKLPADLYMVNGDTTQLHQVLLNLCVNARDAMPNGGTLTLSAENVLLSEPVANTVLETKPGLHVMICVGDTGTGIAKENLDRIFDPFFTTKGLDKGTGLGLATVLGIVRGHNGFIQVKSVAGQGTQFVVYLPALPRATVAESVKKSRVLPQGNGQTILIIDDEDPVCIVTRRVLERNGYRVLAARNGLEGLAIYERKRDEIKVVVTDMMMPVMDGQTAIAGLRQIDPQVKIIVVSGVAPKSIDQLITDLGVQAFLPKPFPTETLMATLEQLLRQ